MLRTVGHRVVLHITWQHAFVLAGNIQVVHRKTTVRRSFRALDPWFDGNHHGSALPP